MPELFHYNTKAKKLIISEYGRSFQVMVEHVLAIDDKDKMIEKSVNTLEEARSQYEQLQVKVKRLSNLDETLKKVFYQIFFENYIKCLKLRLKEL